MPPAKRMISHRSSRPCLWITVIVQFILFILLTFVLLLRDVSINQVSTVMRSAFLSNHRVLPMSSRKSKLFKYNITQTKAAPWPKVPHRQSHMYDHRYIINPAQYACSDLDIYLLVIIESRAINAMERDYFRRRWKKTLYKDHKIRTVFSTAVTALDGIEVQELLESEHKMHGDILQHDFQDSYRNLTLNTILSLKWATEECVNFKYVMKTDDDMIINFDVMINQFQKLPRHIARDLYTGLLMKDKKPIRDDTDKWHVSKQEYSLDFYPDYMGGPGYVLSNSAAQKVVKASVRVPFMPMEDVFVGICIKEAGIKPYCNVRFSNFVMWDYYDYCWCREMITLHNAYFSIRELYYLDLTLNSNRFNFTVWSEEKRAPRPYYGPEDEGGKGDGSPTIYNCAKSVWYNHRYKQLYKHVIKQNITRDMIIDF